MPNNNRLGRPPHLTSQNTYSPNKRNSDVRQTLFIGIILLIPLILAQSVFDMDVNFITQFGPMYFILVMAFIVYNILRIDAYTIWSAYVLLPIQAALFFGLGPLSHHFGTEETLWKLNERVVSVTTEELLRTNLLSTLGTTLLLFGMWFSVPLFKAGDTGRRAQKRPSFSVKFVTYLFLLIGIPLKYLIVMPSAWGMIDLTIPGALNSLSLLVDLGFASLAYLAVQTKKKNYLLLFWLLWPAHLILGVVSLSKATVILSIVMPMLGSFVASRNISRLLIGFLVVAVTYVSLQPWVHYGRAENFAISGKISPENYSQGLSNLANYLSGDASIISTTEVSTAQGWWTRLNYSSEQIFVMGLYDAGLPGRSLNELWMTLIPRAIWPEKPIISRHGQELYTLMTGHDGTSSSGATIYADLYWHYGWLGVWVISPLMGVLFAFLSKIVLSYVRRKDFIYFPVIGLIVKMFLLGPTGIVILSIFGPLPIVFAYIFIIYIGNLLWNTRVDV